MIRFTRDMDTSSLAGLSSNINPNSPIDFHHSVSTVSSFFFPHFLFCIKIFFSVPQSLEFIEGGYPLLEKLLKLFLVHSDETRRVKQAIIEHLSSCVEKWLVDDVIFTPQIIVGITKIRVRALSRSTKKANIYNFLKLGVPP